MNKGSTGNIMLGVANVARTQGHDVLVCYPKCRDNMAKYKEVTIQFTKTLTKPTSVERITVIVISEAVYSSYTDLSVKKDHRMRNRMRDSSGTSVINKSA